VSADRAFRDVEHLLQWIDPAAAAIDQPSGR
jgi:hypothetical protein